MCFYILFCISYIRTVALYSTYFRHGMFYIFLLYGSMWWSIRARDIKSPRRWVTLSCLARNSYSLEYYLWQGQNGKDEYFFCFLLLLHVASFGTLQCLPFTFLRLTNTWSVYPYYISLCIIQILHDVHRKYVKSFLLLKILASVRFSEIQFSSFGNYVSIYRTFFYNFFFCILKVWV